jgi:hypothetical protein
MGKSRINSITASPKQISIHIALNSFVIELSLLVAIATKEKHGSAG